VFFFFTQSSGLPTKKARKTLNIFVFLPKDHKIPNIPIVKKQSPTLLVNNAEIELWLAAILVYQKLTKR